MDVLNHCKEKIQELEKKLMKNLQSKHCVLSLKNEAKDFEIYYFQTHKQ